MKIAICDDDPLELEKVKNVVDEFIFSKKDNYELNINTFTNGDDLLSSINKYGSFDLIILDIIMSGINGIDVATEIRSIDNNCKIIFLTSSPEFAVKSYRVNAYFYLLKPFSNPELMSLLNKALDEIGEDKSESILVKEKGKLTRIQIHTIQYIECVKHKIFFHLRNNEIISCYGTMNEYTDILLSDNRFVKSHKSFLVNMNFVINVSNRDFVMSDKTLIPISRHVYQQVKEIYIGYFFKNGVYLP